MVLMDFGCFSHLLENLIFQKFFKMGHFWAKSMDYSPWFWWILGPFSHLLEKFLHFSKTHSKWVIFEQKAWTIAHGFDRFWVIFTPFGKILWFFKNSQNWPFLEQKAWTIAHGFDGFWVFFTPFFIFQKMFKMGHFWGKAWTLMILGVFHTFWEFLHFSKNFKMGHFWAKSMDYSPWFWWILGHFSHLLGKSSFFQSFQKNFGPFLSKKHGL